jgi:hypothetical protein
MLLTRLSVPTLFWMIACSPAFAASASLKCADGHTISASTGTDMGTCTNTKQKSISCSDGLNSSTVDCGGTGVSTGSGNYTARKSPVQQGGTSPPKSGAGTATSTGTNKSGGATTKSPIGGVSPPTAAGANKGPSGGGTTTSEKSSGSKQ